MKLLIPLKKTVKPPAKKEIVIPDYKGSTPCPHPPRECTFCKHIYGNPCDGQKGCPNHDYLVSKAAKENAA